MTHEPAWLTHLVDQRLALLNEYLPGPSLQNYDIVMMPLKEVHEDDDLAAWNRTCDHCGKYCDNDTDFYTAHSMYKLRSGTPVVFIIGVCTDCTF